MYRSLNDFYKVHDSDISNFIDDLGITYDSHLVHVDPLLLARVIYWRTSRDKYISPYLDKLNVPTINDLEIIGDAVIHLINTNKVMEAPELSGPGDMTRSRSNLDSNVKLQSYGVELGICITKYRKDVKPCSSLVGALIGAFYFDLFYNQNMRYCSIDIIEDWLKLFEHRNVIRKNTIAPKSPKQDNRVPTKGPTKRSSKGSTKMWVPKLPNDYINVPEEWSRVYGYYKYYTMEKLEYMGLGFNEPFLKLDLPLYTRILIWKKGIGQSQLQMNASDTDLAVLERLMDAKGVPPADDLEFLGDAVLHMIHTNEVLKLADPNENVRKRVSDLENNQTLEKLSRSLGLCENITYLKTCADKFEALVGALYLDLFYNKNMRYCCLDHIEDWLYTVRPEW